MPFIYSLLVYISGSFCLSVYLCIYLSIHLSVSLCSSGWPKTLYIHQNQNSQSNKKHLRNHTQDVLWLPYTYIHKHTHTSDYTPTLIDMHTYTYILYTDMHTDTHTDTIIHTHAYTHTPTPSRPHPFMI